jgi:hypothetical protein
MGFTDSTLVVGHLLLKALDPIRTLKINSSKLG